MLRRPAGFTLVEVVVSALILGLVIVSGMATLTQCTSHVTDLQLRARSTQILQHKIEDLRLKSWTELQAQPAVFTDPSDTNGVYAGSLLSSAYQTYGTNVTVRQVTAQVVWTNTHSKVVTNALCTLFSQGGINEIGN